MKKASSCEMNDDCPRCEHIRLSQIIKRKFGAEMDESNYDIVKKVTPLSWNTPTKKIFHVKEEDMK